MQRLPFRRRATGRRGARVQRQTRFVSRTRLLAAVGLMAVSGTLYWAVTDPQFVVDPAAVTIEGVTYADLATVRADLGLDDASINGGRNVFRLPTDDMERRIEALPPVLAAVVDASLPNTLRVKVHERVPIFVWHTGDAAWLVDRAGVVIAAADLAADPVAAALPQITDERSNQPALAPGDRLAAMDLEAARLLGAVTPADLGSVASAIALSINDTDGWVMSVPGGWRAVFGNYTPDLHTTADIPKQVQCLASLLADPKLTITTVVLATAPDRCGTFVEASPTPKVKPGGGPRQSPRPSPTPAPEVTEPPAPTDEPQPSEAARTPKPSR